MLLALRDGSLGSQQEKIVESYRVACHGVYPYAVAFMPPGYQDNSAVTTNGDLSPCDHEDMPNEMWAFQEVSKVAVLWPSAFETRRPTEVETPLH